MSSKKSKVLPTAADDAAPGLTAFEKENAKEVTEAAKGARLNRVVDHLATCVLWKTGICSFEGCNELGPQLHHNLNCVASNGTVREQVAEIYKQHGEKLKKRKLDKLMAKFEGREDRLMALVLKKWDLAPRWCEKCKKAERLQKLHSRHCELEHCKVPFCHDYRHGNATRDERAAAEEAAREQYLRDHRACWWPLCWFSCHRKSTCGQAQVCIEDALLSTASRVNGGSAKPQGAPSDLWNACSFVVGLVVIVTVLVIYS